MSRVNKSHRVPGYTRLYSAFPLSVIVPPIPACNTLRNEDVGITRLRQSTVASGPRLYLKQSSIVVSNLMPIPVKSLNLPRILP